VTIRFLSSVKHQTYIANSHQ